MSESPIIPAEVKAAIVSEVIAQLAPMFGAGCRVVNIINAPVSGNVIQGDYAAIVGGNNTGSINICAEVDRLREENARLREELARLNK